MVVLFLRSLIVLDYCQNCLLFSCLLEQYLSVFQTCTFGFYLVPGVFWQILCSLFCCTYSGFQLLLFFWLCVLYYTFLFDVLSVQLSGEEGTPIFAILELSLFLADTAAPLAEFLVTLA